MAGLSTVASFTKRNKKALWAGGGGLGFIGLLVGAAFLILPLKVEFMVKNIMEKRFGKVEHAYERRSMKLVSKYIAKRSGGEAAEHIVATGAPIKDLYRTWQLNKFEDKLSTNHGIKIVEGSDGKLIRVEFVDGTKVPAAEFEQFLDRDLGAREANKFVKTAVREETKWFQIYKRRHLRTSMRNAFGITKWKIFTGKGGEPGRKEFRKELRRRALEPLRTHLAEWFSCVIGDGQCPGDEDGVKKKSALEGSKDEPAANREIQKAANEAIEDTINDVQPSTVVPEITDEVIGKVAKETGGEVGQKVGAKTAAFFSKVFSSKILTTIAGKLVPIIGWVDLAAKVDKLITENVIDKIATEKNSIQYAGAFATWATTASNIHDGKKSLDEVGEAVSMLDGPTGDISDSAGFNDVVYGQPDKGTRVRPVNSIHGASGVGTSLRDTYLSDPQTKYVTHPILVIYRATVGKVYNFLVNLVGGILNFFIDKGIQFFATVTGIDVNNLISRLVEWIFNVSIGSVMDGTETGPELFNAVDAGADVSSNQLSKDSGGHELTPQQISALNVAINHDRSEIRSHQSLFTKVASLNNPDSSISRLVLFIPSNPKTAIDKSSNYIASIFAFPMGFFQTAAGNLANLTVGSAIADTSADSLDIYGVAQFGFTDEELNVDPESLTPEVCAEIAKDPEVIDGKKGNLCLLDTVVSENLKSWFTDEDDAALSGASQ